MVNQDYGKRAYIMLSELEKRLEKLEKNAIETAYSEIFFNFKEFGKSSYTEEFSLNALKDGRYTFDGQLETSVFSTGEISIKIFVNNILVYSFNKSTNILQPFAFEAPLNKGVNLVRTELSAIETFSIVNLQFKVRGNVDYLKSTNSLSHFVYNNDDYIIHLIDDKVILYLYKNRELVKIKSFLGYKECSILSVLTNVMYLLAISNNNELVIIKCDLSNLNSDMVSLNQNNVSSCCGYYKDGGFDIYFSKLAEIYKGTFLPSINYFDYSNTGRKGMKLYSGPYAYRSYIIVDKFNNAKLITD